jgi:hypothetical protein
MSEAYVHSKAVHVLKLMYRKPGLAYLSVTFLLSMWHRIHFTFYIVSSIAFNLFPNLLKHTLLMSYRKKIVKKY